MMNSRDVKSCFRKALSLLSNTQRHGPSLALRAIVGLAVLWVGIPRAGHAQQEVNVTTEGFSSRSTQDGWTFTRTCSGLEEFAARPSDDSQPAYTVHWEPMELEALGNLCTVRGRLLHQPEGAAEPQPVDWFQGVTLFVATVPGAQPDWSQGMNREDTISDTDSIDPTGEFWMSIDVRELQDDRALAESFQFGIALASHEVVTADKHEVTWSSRAPVIAGSVQMLEIPAAPPLRRELELIDRADGWPFQNPNSVHLIRAVNALQSLGKDEAIAILDEYVRVNRSSDSGWAPCEHVFWIIRLLFEPIRIEDRLPPPAIAVHFVDWRGDKDIAWPLNPIGLVGDVPLMLGQQIFGSGVPEHPLSHLEWAERYGVIRDEPLSPTMNPLVAAEMILNDPAYLEAIGDDESWRYHRTRDFRLRAMSMVEDLLPPITADYYHPEDFELQWRDRLELSIELGITWDAERQEFVVPAAE